MQVSWTKILTVKLGTTHSQTVAASIVSAYFDEAKCKQRPTSELFAHFRSLMFNITTNSSLRSDILSGKINASRTVSLSADDMAHNDIIIERKRIMDEDLKRQLTINNQKLSKCPQCHKVEAITFCCRVPAGNGGGKAVDAMHVSCNACGLNGTQR